jgi:hypothetical protein
MLALSSLPKETLTVVPACLVSEKKEDEDIVDDGVTEMKSSNKMRNILCGAEKQSRLQISKKKKSKKIVT